MSIKIYSANGGLITNLISINEIYQKVEEVEPIEIKSQVALAGPNDNLQIIVDSLEIAEKLGLVWIAKEAGTELIKISIKELYDKRKNLASSLKRYSWKLIDVLSWITGIAPPDTTILLGVEIEKTSGTLRDRNLGFNMVGLSREEIEKRMFLLAVYGDEIKKFVAELVLKADTNHENLIFEENDDCSIKLSIEGDFAVSIEYFSSKREGSFEEPYTTLSTKAVFRKF